MQTVWLDAIEFESLGGWKKESQYVRSVGQSYLIASDKPGVPVSNATTRFSVSENATYRVFVRTKNWHLQGAPGRFKLSVDGLELAHELGKMPTHRWYWEIAGDVKLSAGEHTLEAVDKTGWLSRFADVVITSDMDFTPSPEIDRMLRQRAAIKGIKQTTEEYSFDFVVVGAGPAGFPAAVEAARCGLRTALISGRPTVGGNASNEGTISMDGASPYHKVSWEGGIACEIRNLHMHKNLTYQDSMELIAKDEPNLTIFVDELCIDAEAENGRIISATTVNVDTLNKKKFYAPLFCDCTGDGWLGYYAGAAYRIGREARWQMNEAFAPEEADTLTMSGCVCGTTPTLAKMRTFEARKTDHKVPFTAPEWAVKLPEGENLHRKAVCLYRSEWWMENSNDFDDLWDDEFARDELIRLGLGYYHWLKNSAPLSPELAADVDYYDLCHLALHLSKRENRRLIGDYVFNQNDCVEGKTFPDTVSYCGWNLDVHHPRGIYSGAEGEFYSDATIPRSPLPYRMVYSKNIDNLFIGGRCCSVSHVALGTVRVEATLATLGQAAGAAAHLCHKHKTTPRGIYEKHIKELQQLLLRHDLTIFGISNEDPDDLARRSRVTASSVADDVYLIADGTRDEWCAITSDTYVAPHRHLEGVPTQHYKAELKNTASREVKITARLWARGESIEDLTLLESCDVSLPQGFEGYIDLPFTTTGITKFALSIDRNDEVMWRRRIWVRGTMKTFEMKNNAFAETPEQGRELVFSDKLNACADCSPGNVINGHNRLTLTSLNGWVSANGTLPQSITLTLEEPCEISEVRITTTTDLSYPTYAYKQSTQSVGMATDLTVSLLRGGEWHEAAHVTDNCHKQMVARFERQPAEAVKITVNEARFSQRAEITEVRIYK